MLHPHGRSRAGSEPVPHRLVPHRPLRLPSPVRPPMRSHLPLPSHTSPGHTLPSASHGLPWSPFLPVGIGAYESKRPRRAAARAGLPPSRDSRAAVTCFATLLQQTRAGGGGFDSRRLHFFSTSLRMVSGVLHPCCTYVARGRKGPVENTDCLFVASGVPGRRAAKLGRAPSTLAVERGGQPPFRKDTAMHLRAWVALLVLLSACATTDPSPGELEAPNPRFVNLQRAAQYPWTAVPLDG